MKKVLLLLFVIMVAGCAGTSSNPETGARSDSGLKLIEEKRGVKTYSIDCSSFNSRPELWYLKSGSNVGYYAYIPATMFNHSEYKIGAEQVEDELKFNLTMDEKISRHGQYCSLDMESNQNVDYLYCKPHSFRHLEYSKNGTLTSRGFVTIKTSFQVDKTKERPDTKGKYSLIKDSTLISHECTISF